jgi:hypothetical protein
MHCFRQPQPAYITWDGIQVVVLNGVIRALEHVQHALGDGEASTNVHSRSQHSQSRQTLQQNA